jgi:triosephosphate isomerase (TIM)
MRKKLIVGNWKMNGGLQANAVFLDGLRARYDARQAELAICASAPYWAQLRQCLEGSGIDWGGQDVSCHASGAYTGEVSAAMLQDFACRYVIVGHSERRQYHGESDDAVAQKAQRALAAGLTPIVCVGETLRDREAGRTEFVVKRQLSAVIHAVGHCTSEIVVAYEPVWAIGTGLNASPAQAQAVHAVLRAQLRAATAHAQRNRILYGGSMNPANAAELLAQPDIDGGLVGGASLDLAQFLSIVAACPVTSS